MNEVSLRSEAMKYYLFKLTNEDPKLWAVYEYDSSFTKKIIESPYLVQEVFCIDQIYGNFNGLEFFEKDHINMLYADEITPLPIDQVVAFKLLGKIK